MQDAMEHRTHIVRGLVQSANDAGAAQTVTVTTHDGVTRADVPVMQPYGFSSSAPIDGAVTLVLSVGGDAGDPVALTVGNLSFRFGKLGTGEVVMHDLDGNRVHIRAGGTIEVWAASQVTINAPNVVINGNLTVSGDISDQNGTHGTVAVLRGDYNAHKHGGSPTTDHPTP